MNDEQIRITALTEMFLGLGHEPTPERLAYYTRLTKNIPIEWYRVACDHAVCASKSGFPPNPGEIIDQAERLHREKRVRDAREQARIAWSEHEERVGDDPVEVGKMLDAAFSRFDA